MKDCRTCLYCKLRIGLDCHAYICNNGSTKQTYINNPNQKCNEYMKDKDKTGDFYVDLDNQEDW